MATTKQLPLVAVCGRPNVGKSTLFNRLTGRQTAIVHSQEGVTRDRSYGACEWDGITFRVVDTGGIVENPLDPITRHMQGQVEVALRESSVIIFVVDGQQEITRTDHEVCEHLFKLGKPVVLAVNKLDNPEMELQAAEFYELGIGEPWPVSTTHGRGIDDLVHAVAEHLPEGGFVSREDLDAIEAEEKAGPTRVAVLGKPNVGKSSYINGILNEERAIVTDIPGTTREALDIDFVWQGKEFVLIDTAGMRRRRGIKEAVEHYSVSRSLRAVRRADVCLVMIDAVDGVTDQDKRILNYVVEQGRGMVIVFTKWDLVEDKDRRFKELAAEMDREMPFLSYVPYLTLSNVTRKRLFTTFEYVDRVASEAKKRVGTGELNRVLDEVRHTPAASHKGRAAKVLYGTQASVKPTVFVMFVNQKKLFHFSFIRHIENRIRAHYAYEGVPIQIELREERREK